MTKKNSYKSQKKNFIENKREVPSLKKSFFPVVNLSDRQLVIFARTIFFLFSFWFLGVYNAEVLYKLQARSLFLHNPEFASDILNQSAGFLIYISRFLMQFLYYPLLGALLLSVGLLGIEWWISRLFKVPVRYFFVSFIPPGLILLAQTSIWYALYHRFEVSTVFSLVLGALFALLLFTFYRKVRNFAWGIWIALLVFLAFFFLIGVYALVALMMVGIERVVNKEKYAVPLLIGGLLIGVFLPFVAGKYIFHESYMVGVVAPLPDPFFKRVFVFSVLSQVGLIFYSVLFLFKGLKEIKDIKEVKEKKGLDKVVGANLLLFCFSLFAVFYFSFRDGNFRLELKLQRLTEKYEWDEVIKEAEKAQEPTKAIAAYRVIALANTDQLSQRLFDFNYQNKPSASAYMDGFQRLYYYSELFFHASFPNVAYLWNMEFLVSMGSNFHLLKQMALCAMLSGEKELASKYLNLLKQSLFYKKWAEKQERYNDNPDTLMENPVYKQIKQYMPEENFVIPVNYSLPIYYMFLEKSFVKNKEKCLLAGLYTRDIKQFMQDMQSVQSDDELPVCVQEGLLIYAIANNDFRVLERFRIDGKLKEKVTRFVNEYKRYGNNPNLAEEKLRKNYKGTYCYFYFFKKSD